jgi:hypothetical protein|nr:MAG TPA: hypothetical protein [Caudoviricetes sp.]
MKTYKKFFDIGFRDGPVLFALGKLHIGSYIDTHTTLLNNVLDLNLEFETVKESLDINRNSKEITRFEDIEGKCLFGNLTQGTIYWEHFSDKKLLSKVEKLEPNYRHKILCYKQKRGKK